MAKILVVEDIPDTRQMMVDLLENLGHTALEAQDGLDGVRVALSDRPDLILLDLMMPTASGDSALSFMRGTPELANIPIIVVSAHPDIELIATQLGANAWLSKPVIYDDLRRLINEILSQASASSSNG
ncbi:MAG: response regulator [Candidatus Thermofonsia Clade 1 bacterium]|jgi:CheY-like chemotaxis protein|uniref:Response regulator n=1 Tax=Candidatus Thermofonsia Clade 1 bacterium TaxID=2364210 RepID=A0A2M8PD51_9CHLR|nr:MAG: response regulator [Candidatus Thermofonsia Clade 1 bacterium]RMF50424.1 MAG: response regulator [Chloroflexota bacterium]